MEYSKTFCQNLKHLRELKNLSQFQIAEKLGIDRSLYISMEEEPHKAPPDFNLLVKLCEFFEISANALLFCDLKNNEYTFLKKYFSTNELKEIISDIDDALLEVSNIRDYVLSLGEENGY